MCEVCPLSPLLTRHVPSQPRFPCKEFDVGDSETPVTYMAADLSVSCGGKAEPRGSIITIATMAVIATIPLIIGMMFFLLWPIRDVLETRTEKECSPLVDFAVSRWKPKMWYFAIIDLLRRVVCTSGLLVLHGWPQTQLLLAIVLNFGFTTLYRCKELVFVVQQEWFRDSSN